MQRLGKDRRDRQHLHILQFLDVLAHREGVGDDHLIDGCVLDPVEGGVRENPVGRCDANALGAVLRDHLGGIAHRAGSVDHVVDDHDMAIGHLSGHRQGGRLVVLVRLAALVDERNRCVQMAGISLGPLHTARVGRKNRGLPLDLVSQILGDDRQSSQRVERLADEALELASVEIDRYQAIGSCTYQEVNDQTRSYRLPRQHLLVLARVTEERHHGRDAPRGGALEGVDGDQLLHDVVVDRRGVALEDEAVCSTDTFVRTHVDLAIGELGAMELAQLDAEHLSHFVGKGLICPSREDHHSVAGDDVHVSPLPVSRSSASLVVQRSRVFPPGQNAPPPKHRQRRLW